jgi:UMF1 family MFS transporter
MGRIVPADMQSEFFGFFAVSGKLTAFVGPFTLGLLTQLSGSQRVGVTIVIVLFLLGLVLLQPVAERRHD